MTPMPNTIAKKLYGGEVDLAFYPESHRYKLAGSKDWLISVTAATGMLDKSKPLMKWAVGITTSYIRKQLEEATGTSFDIDMLNRIVTDAAGQYEVRREEAATIGSMVHDWAQAFALAKGTGSELPAIPDDADPRVVAGIHAFLDWNEKHEVEYLAVEQLVYSRRHDFAGHFDVYARVDGRLSIGDYKTGSGVYSEHRYQLSAYWEAHEEEFGAKIEQGLILHFDKETGKFEAVAIDRTEHEKNLPVFLALLAVKRREKELDAAWRAARKAEAVPALPL